ncbi:hypothetical protein BVC80_977g5 [Macleaya cordata]|uniref:Endonuclease/exonuclease/phosphatase n=1 Tax=Macleaya cordata TaxID=56857 RepID=A0A200QRL6_MACCD|nr:hypothetical protein BVC80_977g5 [Macleaya cordata]
MKPQIISWNVKGLGQADKRLMIKDSLRRWKANIAILQETKIQNTEARMVRETWGNGLCDFIALPADGSKGVYGPSIKEQRKEFWEELYDSGVKWDHLWCLGGDFN